MPTRYQMKGRAFQRSAPTARQRENLGYTPDNLPFAFRNGRGELVGFDIEMAHRLAADLEVDLELVPVDSEKLADHLRIRLEVA